jgi:hypothetical protein
MNSPLQKITVKGEERELLYSLSLYKVLNDRKQCVVISKDATWNDVTSAFLRMIYAAYINAIEVRQIDEPKYNPDRLAYMDFVIWSEGDTKAFGEQIQLCYKFITGKDLEVDIQKKKIQLKALPRTSIWSKIGKIFKTS